MILRRSKNVHKPLSYSKSCPMRVESVSKVVKDTIGSIAESEKEVESAARGMEYIISKERRAIEEFERKSQINGGRGTLRGWITLKKESEKNRRAALEDMRRAMEAVKVAEGNVIALGDRLEEDERELQERATALRRKSCDLFKKVSPKNERRASTASNIVDVVTQAERAEYA